MKPKNLIAQEKYLRLFAVFSILLGLSLVVVLVDNVLSSLVVAVVVNYLLSPFVKWLERRNVPRAVSVSLPFFGFLAGIAGLVALLAPALNRQFTKFQSEFPKLQQETLEFLGRVELRFHETFHLQAFPLREKISDWVFDQTALLTTQIPTWFAQSLTVLMLWPFLSYFLLLDGRQMIRRFLSLAPNQFFELFLNLQYQINHQIGGFIRVRLLEGAIVGLCVGLGLALMGFPYAILLAVVAGVTNLIPYLGPVIGVLPALLLAVVTPEAMPFESLGANLLLLGAIYTAAQAIDNFVVIPLMVARIVDLHPLVVVLTIVIGAQVMGILGMIISIPVVAAGKLIVVSLFRHLLYFRANQP